MQRNSLLIKASLVAGILGAVFALFQLLIAKGYLIKGNQGPVIFTQESTNTTVVINSPPPRLASDQENCPSGERWVGFNPNEAEFRGSVPLEKIPNAVLRGKFRWSPSLNGAKNSTNGEVVLAVGGKKTIVYQWSSPDTSVQEFEVPVATYLSGSSGEFIVTWTYTNGNSGVCIAKSEINA